MSVAKASYRTLDFPTAVPGSQTLLTGIRLVEGKYYITGFYVANPETPAVSFLYVGPADGSGKWRVLTFEDQSGPRVTNLYGPNVFREYQLVQVVGNYVGADAVGNDWTESPSFPGIPAKRSEAEPVACLGRGHWVLESGPSAQPSVSSIRWKTITPATATKSIAHSLDHSLVVGNYASETITSAAFIYNICSNKFYDIVPPPEISIVTAYGIWYDGHRRYTICGASDGLAFLVQWNSRTKTLGKWRFFSYLGTATRTHFNGLAKDHCGNYLVIGDATLEGQPQPVAFSAIINLKDQAYWQPVEVPGATGPTSANSIASDGTVIGVFELGETVHGFIYT